MNSYDLFARVYDPALERLYRSYRRKATEALQLEADSRVLIPGCGTGQDLEGVVPSLGAAGGVLGVDRSAGMLNRARRRVARRNWSNVELREADARTLPDMALGRVDRVLFFLTLSVLPDWRAVLQAAWEILEPGGRCVIFDVHAARRVPQSHIVEWVARADLQRRVWQPLMKIAPDAEHRVLPGSAHVHGGELHLCAATRAMTHESGVNEQ